MSRSVLRATAVLAVALAGCATAPAPGAIPSSRRPLASPLPRSSIAAVLARRGDLELSEVEVKRLEELATVLDRERGELLAAGRAAQAPARGKVQGRRNERGGPPAGGVGGPGSDGPGGAGGPGMAGPGGGPPGGQGPPAGTPARPDEALETRLDTADTLAYQRAEVALAPPHREPAREVAARYRAALSDEREALRRATAR